MPWSARHGYAGRSAVPARHGALRMGIHQDAEAWIAENLGEVVEKQGVGGGSGLAAASGGQLRTIANLDYRKCRFCYCASKLST